MLNTLIVALTIGISFLPYLVTGSSLLLLIPGMAVVGIVWYGSAFIGSNLFVKVCCHGDRGFRRVALTFDDGPSEPGTRHILEVLDAYGVKAAFFCTGVAIEQHRELLREIDRRGHVIGNHSYAHRWQQHFALSRFLVKDFRKNADLIKEIIKKEVKYYRPPIGITNGFLKKAAEIMGYTVIGWEARGFDTVIRNPAKILHRINRNVRPGSIILLHDTNPEIGILLKELIEHLKANHFEVVRLDEITGVAAYE